MRIYYTSDADPELIKSRSVAVIGFGSQGRAHANNLRDSGVDVCVGLRQGSASAQRAKADGLAVYSPADAVKKSSVVMLLAPDEHHLDIYEQDIEPNLQTGGLLLFAHGLNIHYQRIVPRSDIDVAMVAPKGPGHTVRALYKKGHGVPCLLAVHRDASGKAAETALAYSWGIGGTRGGVIETTFRDETETDLFGEQAVLCGGVVELMKAGFDTLVDAGYAPELAYFECIHELKLIVDLVYEGGFANMAHSVSNTAEFGGYKAGERIIDKGTRKRMRQLLKEVQNGDFVRQFLTDQKMGQVGLKAERRQLDRHGSVEVGEKLRDMMSWISEDRLVSQDENET